MCYFPPIYMQLGCQKLTLCFNMGFLRHKSVGVKNLDAFQSEGFVSKSQRSVIEPVLEAGHATMHRSYKPSRNEVVACLDVSESIIESIYINESRAKQISKKVPPRKTGRKD